MKIRFIDAGTVSGWRSQSVYHGLGFAQTPETPDTIVAVTPGTPYMCIGYFQDPANELNLKYCRKHNLPVIRRETGGGAVYIDSGQLFVQWIFQQQSLPARIDRRFRLFVKPLIDTYKFFGINAYYHPVNDVHVNGKKIVGTGAGTIGEAQVVTGNFLFDFNYEVMLQALNLPSGAFREAAAENLRRFLTTMQKELGHLPDRKEVIAVYRRKCEETLGVKLEDGKLTGAEHRAIEKAEEKFRDEAWLFGGRKKTPGDKLLKIHLGVWVGEAALQSADAQYKALVTLNEGKIEGLKLEISGVETTYNVREIEKYLIGQVLKRPAIEPKIRAVTGGPDTKNWVECIYKVKQMQLQQTPNGTMERHH